jgi:hypothetical protein
VVEPDASQLRRSPVEVVRLLLLFCGANTYGPFGDPEGFSSQETVSLLLDGLLKRDGDTELDAGSKRDGDTELDAGSKRDTETRQGWKHGADAHDAAIERAATQYAEQQQAALEYAARLHAATPYAEER